jgi:alpha-galactosidase
MNGRVLTHSITHSYGPRELHVNNGWGPVERDTSNGESALGDGYPITIAGTVYPKGLGMHAPGGVGYYLGKHCSRLTVTVGVDDEVGDRGHVAFDVMGDRIPKAHAEASGSGGPVSLDVDVTGVDLLELRLDTTIDGPDFDHADWAVPVLTCS